MPDARMTWSPRWKSLACVLLLLVCYGPLLAEFAANLWAREHYQHSPFVIVAVGVLLYSRSKPSKSRQEPTIRLPRLAPAALRLSWVLLAAAIWLHSPWLAAISAILLVGALLSKSALVDSVKYLGGIWMLLWLVIPPPLNLDRRLITALQSWSSSISSFLLDSLGINHLMLGNALLLPGRELFVDEACSGIVSAMSIVACAAIYAVWKNRPPLHVVLLVFAGVGWAMLTNIVRITSIAFVFVTWGWDWTSGMAHQLLGFCLFLAAFFALVGTDLLLLGCLQPIQKPYHLITGNAPRFGAGLAALFDRAVALGDPRCELAAAGETSRHVYQLGDHIFRPSRTTLLAFSLLALFHWVVIVDSLGVSSAPVLIDLHQAKAIDAESLPQRLAGLNKIEFRATERESGDLFGEYSRAFVFANGPVLFTVSCDFPFPGEWHDLKTCYQYVGWELSRAETINLVDEARHPPWGLVQASLVRPKQQEHGFVAYALFDQYGQMMSPPANADQLLPEEAWLQSLLSSLRPRRPKERAKRELFQVQVWVAAARQISEHERKIALDLLCEAREYFKTLVTRDREQ